MNIRAPHPKIDQPNTYLTSSAAVGATALTVANNGSFVANDYFVQGKVGQEGSTINKISTVSGNNTINIVGDALKFAISVNTSVTYIKYNQVRFYLGDYSSGYSTGTVSISKDSYTLTGSSTVWSAITTDYALLLNGKWYDIASKDSDTQITLLDQFTDEDLSDESYILVPFSVQATVDIKIDQEYTIWDDTDSILEDYYRTEYYNSTSTACSARSNIIAAVEPQGFTEFSLKVMTDDVLEKLQDIDAKRHTRSGIRRDFNDCQREMIKKILKDVKEDYLNTHKKIDLPKSGEKTLPNDFKKLTMVWVSYDGINYKKADSMNIGKDDPGYNYSESHPYYYLRDNVIGVKPVPTASVIEDD